MLLVLRLQDLSLSYLPHRLHPFPSAKEEPGPSLFVFPSSINDPGEQQTILHVRIVETPVSVSGVSKACFRVRNLISLFHFICEGLGQHENQSLEGEADYTSPSGHLQVWCRPARELRIEKV